MSEDFEDYLRIYVPKDLRLIDEHGDGWELEALLDTVEEAMKAARSSRDGEVYQMTVEVPAALALDERSLFFEAIATAAHDFEERFPDRTWDVFVAGGVLNEEHSAEGAFRRVFNEREELRAEVEQLRTLMHTLYKSVIWTDTDLTAKQRELFTKAYIWAEQEAGR